MQLKPSLLPLLLLPLLWMPPVQAQDCTNANLATFNNCTLTASRAYADGKGSGVLTVFPATTSSQLTLNKPVLLVSGWDPLGDMTADSLYEQLNQTGLADRLRQAGFDLVVLSFGQHSNDYIQRNALVVLDALTLMHQLGKGAAEIPVIGISAGGLFSRYALSYAEHNAIPHYSNLWVSYDSPHSGAHIPLSLQYVARYVNHASARATSILQDNYSTSVSILKGLSVLLLGPLAGIPAVEGIDAFWSDIKRQAFTSVLAPDFSTAALGRQLLLNHLDAPAYGQHALRQTLLSELNALGNYPKVRKVTVVNGALNGRQPGVSGTKYMDFSLHAHLPDPLAGGGDDFENDFWLGVTPSVPDTALFAGVESGPIRKCDSFLGVETSCWYSYEGGAYVGYHELRSTASIQALDNVPGSLMPTPYFVYDQARQQAKSICGQFNGNGISCSQTVKFYNNYTHAFIPSMSALGMDSRYVNANLLALGGNSLETLAKQYTPFDKIYAVNSGNTNSSHMDIDAQVADGLFNEINAAYGKSVFAKIAPALSLLLDDDTETTIALTPKAKAIFDCADQVYPTLFFNAKERAEGEVFIRDYPSGWSLKIHKNGVNFWYKAPGMADYDGQYSLDVINQIHCTPHGKGY